MKSLCYYELRNISYCTITNTVISMGRYAKKIKCWTDDNLKNALDAIEDGLPCKTAARRHGMPYSVLKWRLDKKLRCEPFTGQGRKRPLDSEEEEKFVLYINTLCRFGFHPKSMDDLLKLTSYLIVRRGLKNDDIKHVLPGKYWAEAFAQRHNFSFKEMRLMMKAHTNSSSVRHPTVVQNFYNRLEDVTTEFNLGPNQIWTMYEVGFPNYIFGDDFSFDANELESTTCVAICNASGQALAPLIIHTEKHSSMKRNDFSFCATSETGCLTPELFEDWFGSFLSSVSVRPLFIIVDSALSHLSLNSVELALSEGVNIVKQPCRTKKPLDLCFDLFKVKWRAILQTWMKVNMRLMSEQVFTKQISSIWYKCLSHKLIVEGFESAGVYPLDKSKFLKPVAAGSMVAGKMPGTSDISDPHAAVSYLENGTGNLDSQISSTIMSASGKDQMKRKQSILLYLANGKKPDTTPVNGAAATRINQSLAYPCWCSRPPPSVPGKKWVPIWNLVDDETQHQSASSHQIKDVKLVLEKMDFLVVGETYKVPPTLDHIQTKS